jgi:tetratricopeptide (TPR) repeat protein
VARVNLRAAFMSGVDSPVAAQQVFTNRSSEVAAFERARAELDRLLGAAEVSPVVDRVQGRRNVLCFYGLGGIGKTTLSLELERRALVADDRAVAVRVDLAEAGATDLETLLLRLRAGLGQLGSKWSAFDLALACYWARAHPGEPLQAFLDSSPMVRRVANSVGLGEQIKENVNLVAPVELGGLPGLAQKAALGAYRVIRDRVREGMLMADCDLFAELVEADADYETLSFFPYLLAWDLDRMTRRRRSSVCVFLDTFEVLAGHNDQTAERFVQRMVYLMPNVLFVITGRNRIDWADSGAGAELDFTGPERWPNLHFSNSTDEPRQHLVGYLSDSDADSYLREALVRDGAPAIPDDVRQQIVAGGQGLPLYLDLSVSHFVELLARGVVPGVDAFGGSFTAVATRAIRDLSREERDLVRTAALVDRFDAELLRAGQPGLNDGTVARFLRRPFLLHDDSYDLPYALHQALRAAIAEADATMPDGWSDRDRRDVADRLLEGLGARATATAGRSTVAAALESGFALAEEYDVFDDWLVSATQRLVEAGQWATFGGWLPATQGGSPSARALRASIDGVVLRRAGRPAEAVRVLERVDPGIDDAAPVKQLVDLHRAHALRNTGEYHQAAEIYRHLLGGEFDSTARYWLCDHDFLVGRFARAVAELDAMVSTNAAEEGERLRLLGHIYRVNAQFDVAADRYRQAITVAQSEGLAAAEAKAQANIAQTACWTGERQVLADAAARARQLLDLVPNHVELVKVIAAEAVSAVLGGDEVAAEDFVAAARRVADDIGYRGGHTLADLAVILQHSRAGESDQGLSTLAELETRTRSSGGNTYWVPIAATWLEPVEGAVARGADLDWLDGAESTLRRWAAVVSP